MGLVGTAERGVSTFMAECFWPGVTMQKVEDAGERLRQSALAMSARGNGARYIGSILIPIDEIALCLFEATSMAAALELDEQAAIPSERVLEIVLPRSSAKESPVEPS